MSIIKSFTYSLAIAVAFAAFSQTGIAQETKGELTAQSSKIEAVKTTEADSKVTVALDEEGKLNGNVFLKADDKKPVDAKITLTHDGVVVDTVEANEEGVFSFASIEPGSYQMMGTSDSFVGGQSFDVVPYGGSGCSSCDLGLSNGYSSDAMYDSYASSPVDSFSASPCNSCNTCGGGLGSRLGGGMGGGGFGGGGLLSRPLLLGGITGGIIAIASGGDDEISPAE